MTSTAYNSPNAVYLLLYDYVNVGKGVSLPPPASPERSSSSEPGGRKHTLPHQIFSLQLHQQKALPLLRQSF
jgi:hypothetical protein